MTSQKDTATALNAKRNISAPKTPLDEALRAISASGMSVPSQSSSLNHSTMGCGAILHDRWGNPYGFGKKPGQERGFGGMGSSGTLWGLQQVQGHSVAAR